MRFLLYVSEAMQQQCDRHTIMDIWHHTVTSNVVNDIVYAHPWLERWTHGTHGGRVVIEEFMSRRSVGRLRLGHIHRDTEQILLEIATEDGVETEFTRFVHELGYVPESLFYFLIGWPERLVVKDVTIDTHGEKPSASQAGPAH
jgi:hypothetical protein